MSYSRNYKTFPVLPLILLVCSFCGATTLVFCVTPHGIIVATDSMASNFSVGRAGKSVQPYQRVKKAIIVQDRIVVATVNMTIMDFSHTGHPEDAIRYNFTQWMAEVDEQCPKNVSVSALTSLLEIKSRTTFENVNKAIAGGAFNQKKPSQPFVEYFIAGYQSGIPTITHLYFNIDWDKNRLTDPIIGEIHPDHDPRVDFGFGVAGRADVIDQLRNRESDGYKEMLDLIPHELPKVISEQDLSIREATNLCLAVLRYETRHNNSLVGAPYVIITIPPLGGGAPSRVVYSK